MNNVAKLIEMLRRDWSQPREAIHRGEPSPFALTCFFDQPLSSEAEIELLPVHVSQELRDFWFTAKRAELFKDQQFGQWGIEIFSPADAAIETTRQLQDRAQDFDKSDLVVGRFFGDSDLLILRCDKSQPDYGLVRVALPLDSRADWPKVASSFNQFLERLINAQGDKYWEISQ